MRIYDVADLIVASGYGRMDVMRYAEQEWGVSPKQAERYYYGGLNYLKPENPDEYRDALINRNLHLVESVFRRALDSGDLKEANNALKIMNSMLGIGGKNVEITDKDAAAGTEKKIIISFDN